jgi:hypothetical protein
MSSEGRLSQSGTFQSLVSTTGYLHNLSLKNSAIENTKSASKQDADQSESEYPTVEEKKEENVSTENRGHRDPRNLLYYINTMGKPYFAFFLFLVAIEVVFIALQRN